MAHSKDPFWSKVYLTLCVFAALGLVFYVVTGKSTILVIAVLAFMIIGIIAADADHHAEKKARRDAILALTAPTTPARSTPRIDPETDRHRRAQEAMNLENWSTNDHREPPVTGEDRER